MGNLARCREVGGRSRAGAHGWGRHGLGRFGACVLGLGAAALPACAFDPPELDERDRDAMPGLPDDRPGNGDAGTPECAWELPPAHVEPCAPGKPRLASDLRIDGSGQVVYDTTTGEVDGVVPEEPLMVTDEGGVHTIWVRNFSLESNVTLRVRGEHPLMIVASGEITVKGTIDASSAWDPVMRGYDRGPGSPSECPTAPALEGSSCDEGGGGGGGGGFGGAGGVGGDGGGLRDCGDVKGAPGGEGGAEVPVPAKIRAGCDGAHGGEGNGDDWYGVGGAGGGAVHLVAAKGIKVEGTIHAGGAGGAPAQDRRSGGGGGGSGGYIGLEAPKIEIGVDAILAANGGGGGGGTEDPGQADEGRNGLPGADAAAGGSGYLGGIGGAGNKDARLAGLSGGNGDRGGGGGGGGAGYIVVYQSEPTLAGEPVVTPPLTTPP
jgi:hypothetical protein